MNYLISIIIPTYNRGHLIAETLDSILAQTYKNWECIIIDDNSLDDTIDILKQYQVKDSRISYFIRPDNLQKGANSCRNYGFKLSKGMYINWFDSDDIMFPNFLEMKLDAILKGKYDFVISKSAFFYNNDLTKLKPYNYKFDKFKINPYNFVSHKINWLTPDIMIRRSVIEGKIGFNEKLLTTAQEYNFFCKLLFISINCFVINKILTGYRQHDKSIESDLRNNKRKHTIELCKAYFITILDLNLIADNKIITFLYESIIRRSLDAKLNLDLVCISYRYLKRNSNNLTALSYLLYQFFFFNLNRGHVIRKYFVNRYSFKSKWEY